MQWVVAVGVSRARLGLQVARVDYADVCRHALAQAESDEVPWHEERRVDGTLLAPTDDRA